MNLVKLAEKISTEGHRGQFRRNGKTPYITHPLAVRDIALGWVNSYLNNTIDFIQNSEKGMYILLVRAIVNTTIPENCIHYDEFKQIVSILSIAHDLEEDCKDKGFTISYLIRELIKVSPDYVIISEFFDIISDNLILLTHDEKDSYLDYILKVKTNPLATLIKIADITHNISTRLDSNAGDLKRARIAIDKYELAKHILLN